MLHLYGQLNGETVEFVINSRWNMQKLDKYLKLVNFNEGAATEVGIKPFMAREYIKWYSLEFRRAIIRLAMRQPSVWDHNSPISIPSILNRDLNMVAIDALTVLCSASAKLYVDDTHFPSNTIIGPETYLQAI